jgi:response regulator RpfG family c-di-GMP phosphodiesterase
MTTCNQTALPTDEAFVRAGGAESTGALRVLVVDDEPAACKLLSIILGAPTFQCVTANDGKSALAALERESVDAVISDLCMPGMGGMELLAEARRRYPYVAFLVTTGIDDVEVGVQAMRSGADDYLVKPLVESVVVAGLERALHKRNLERQVENYRQRLEEMVSERTKQLQAALRQIERGYEDTLQALAAAIDLRDSETAGHSDRVTQYSLHLGRAMQLSPESLAVIARGGYLHDVGKLGIPDSILLKPGPLTPDEWKVMRQHVQIGFDLVQGIPFLADAAEIILAHHERFDGSGYPRGLKGHEIPIGARIFAVADTLDAITSDRPYRRASTFATGRETIRLQSGRQFDAEIVGLFLDIPEGTWQNIAQKQRQSAPITSRPGTRKIVPPSNINLT